MSHSVGPRVGSYTYGPRVESSQRRAKDLGWPKTAEELEGRLDGMDRQTAGTNKYTAVLDGMFHSLVGSSANDGEVFEFDENLNLRGEGREVPEFDTFKVYFNAGGAIHTVEIRDLDDIVTVLLPLEAGPVKHLLHQYKEIHWSFDCRRVDATEDEYTQHVTRCNPTATLAVCVLTYHYANGKRHGIRVDTVSNTFAGDARKEEMFWADLTPKAQTGFITAEELTTQTVAALKVRADELGQALSEEDAALLASSLNQASITTLPESQAEVDEMLGKFKGMGGGEFEATLMLIKEMGD